MTVPSALFSGEAQPAWSHDHEDRHPVPGTATSNYWADEYLVGSKSGSKTISAGVIIASSAAAVRPALNDHFFEQDILVFTRATAGTYAEQAQDWFLTQDLGSIVSAVTKQVELYNSHRRQIAPDEPTTLTDITLINGSGITVVSEETLPFVLNEYKSLLVDIDVSPDGDPAVDVTITFDLSPGSDGVILLTGTRVNVFGFCPQRDPKELIEFGTEVFISRAGFEQRHSFRLRPNVFYDYLYRMEDPERQAFINKLIGNGARLFTIPTWFESEALTADLPIGTSVIPVDTRYADYRTDGNSLLMLWRAWNDFEVVPISSRTDSTVTLTSPTLQAHSALVTIVMPMRLGFIDTRTRGRRYRRALEDFRVRWEITDHTDRERMLGVAAQNTYQGLPIIESPNFTSRQLREDFNQRFERADSGGGGNVAVFRPRDIPEITSRKTWISDGRQGRWDLRGLLHQLRGRRQAFYMSTYAEDFTPTQALSTGSATLDYSPNEYTEQIANGDPRRDIEVVLKDGTILRRRVTASTDDGETTGQLTVDSNWGQDVAIDEIDRVSYLIKYRLNSDRITMEHADSNETFVAAPLLEILQ